LGRNSDELREIVRAAMQEMLDAQLVLHLHS